MIKPIFTHSFYVKVSIDKIKAKNLSTDSKWVSSFAKKPFSTSRLLIGEFSNAEPLLRQLIKDLSKKSFLKKSPMVIIQPLDKIENGLCEVETKILKELAFGAGAFNVVVHVGKVLSDIEALEKLK